jgi:cell division protease FtsH
MFTEKGQAIINLAKDYAYAYGSQHLDLRAVLAAFTAHTEAAVLLTGCIKLPLDKLKAVTADFPEPVNCLNKLPLAPETRGLIASAQDLAAVAPDPGHPGLIDVRHLVCAFALSPAGCALLSAPPHTRDQMLAVLTEWYKTSLKIPRIDMLTSQLSQLRAALLTQIFGQNHAIHAFVEGLFNAEVVAAADTSRRTPRALFVFAGPPGVGKTYLGELGASYLERPFRRFDMSAYSGHQQHEGLVGSSKMYVNARPGVLTDYVKKNPTAILLFDEIEKAHINTIHLFLQILDAGTLEDKFMEEMVSFRDTTIIFTTNAGRLLYDRPNRSGVHTANTGFHRKTILDALENEKDANTQQAFFPASICSRMATGYPVLFNYLGVNELESIARAELSRVADLLARQYYKQITFDDLLPICLVLREGAQIDARTLRSQAEAFVKMELFKFCQLFETDRLEDVFAQIDHVHFGVEPSSMGASEVAQLFESQEPPKVLLIADQNRCDLYRTHITDMDWYTASDPDDVMELLAKNDIDLVLLDIWIGRESDTGSKTVLQFDRAPITSRGLAAGQELLRTIHDRLPEASVYLLSLGEGADGDETLSSVDEALFAACVRAGGARGLIFSAFHDDFTPDWQLRRERFAASLRLVCQRQHREKRAALLGQERKILSFDTVPRRNRSGRDVSIRVRNFRLSRAIAAIDAGEILQEVDRPATRFDDVIGAKTAKEELQFFCDFLRNPRRFAALGLRPPKGVLLHGLPGTGKTMLARAMAGEANIAFISASASNFVTIWQGSGPQNIRDLFARARRYAPAIVFIDEIDAIGKERVGGIGNQAQETTLNALLTEMDGFSSNTMLRPVFVLAATNFAINEQQSDGRRAMTLDPALVRRFDRAILIDLPDRADRAQYLSKRLIGRTASLVTAAGIDHIAKMTPGFSIAQLENVIESAARAAAKTDGILTDAMLDEALLASRFGEVRVWDSSTLASTARHEAGHTVMYWLSGWRPLYVTIVARDRFGGFMAHAPEEYERGGFSRAELLAQIRTLLGGRAAEIVFYGPTQGLTTGASNDLAVATATARQLICRYGMDEEIGLISFSEEEATHGPMAPVINAAVAKLLKQEMQRTIETLQSHQTYVEAIAEALVDKNRISAEEIQQLLASLNNRPDGNE